MNRLSKLLFLLVFSIPLFGQNAPLYSNFMFNQPLFNPASIGRDEAIDISVLYRNQWVGIEGNPTVIAFSIHSPLTFANSNAGLHVINELQGEERETRVLMSYAFRQPFKTGSLAIGFSGGIIQKSLNGANLNPPEPENDQFIPKNLQSDIVPEINLGVYYMRKNMYVGLSVNNLIESKASLAVNGNIVDLRLSRHYVFSGGYKFDLTRKLNLQTNVLIRTDLIKVQTDINVLVQYSNNIYGGLSFRGISQSTKDAVVALLGFKIVKNLRIGYSYDFSLSDLNNINSGSHEVFLNYQVNLKDLLKPGKVIYSPRFL